MSTLHIEYDPREHAYFIADADGFDITGLNYPDYLEAEAVLDRTLAERAAELE